MKKTITTSLLLLLTCCCFSQTAAPDSTKTMDSVVLKASDQKSAVTLCCSVPVKDPVFSSKTSLVNGLNTVAGVRMEERSPGSYRLSIRGSSLRSPFGVRNIKVYWNGIPVTDPGGNTYFNQFAWNNFSSILINKGPAGAGVGTGGIVLLDQAGGSWRNGITAEYITGSYNLQNFFLTARAGSKYGLSNTNNSTEHTITYAHNETDGYRVHTNLRRDNFSWTGKMAFDKQKLTASLLYTDLYYQTPGALTLTEYTADPRAARHAGGGFPSAVNAKAAIYQKNILAGINDDINIAGKLKNTTTIFGSFAQIKNPAIRNYERRSEPSFGIRSSLRYGSFRPTADPILRFDIVAGMEFQQGFFNTQVSKNRNGNPDTLQTNDDININTRLFFLQLEGSGDQWGFLLGASNNSSGLSITRLNKYPVVKQSRRYRNELTPRLYAWKSFTSSKNSYYLSATVSKGFSPPTTAEVLPSTGVISTDLEAEKGWNIESTLTAYLWKKKLEITLTGFYFKLYDALVQRRDLSGADYFVNAGDIRQKGLEFRMDYHSEIMYGSFLRQAKLRSDITLNHFRYGSFIKGTDDFSGKKVPSVPSSVLSLLADLDFKNGVYCSASYYGASAIYLNDANTFKADPYHLLGLQVGWKKKDKDAVRLNVFAGIDNLLNETYSLGNDINAAANRFYNAAPLRNYYAGVSVQWIKQNKPKK